MARLRNPEQGCPWDLEQNFASIAPYTLEEAYEVADAIQRGDAEDLCEELGDLLFSCVNLARFLDADAESLVRDANHKFEARFRIVEALARERRLELRDCSLEELETLWQQAKRQSA